MGMEPISKADPMELKMHPSVQKVAEFMRRELPANEWRAVAGALALAAPVIWSAFPEEKIHPITLEYASIT